VLVVPDPVAYWAGELASAFWQQPSSRFRLIGVTGTNGKTTTSFLIEHLAARAGHPAALFGTLVNRWPGHSVTAQHTTAFADTLQTQLAQAVEAGARIGAMEVSSHALDQQRVAGCRYAGVVFTNLTQDHLDYHPTMDDYFAAKAKLFAPPLLTGGAVVNIDDPWGRRLADQLRQENRLCWSSSLEDPEADLRIVDLEMAADGVAGTLVSPVGEGAFRSPLVGRFNLMNLLEAVGVLQQQGIPLAKLLEAKTELGRWMLALTAIAVTGFLVWWLSSVKDLRLAAAIGLIIGGAVGNVIDRMVYGAVADFFLLHAFGYNWYVFNIADIAVVGGVILMALDLVLTETKGKLRDAKEDRS
jgi:UDP-N-acetylmuramyl-tripeptide synthetase